MADWVVFTSETLPADASGARGSASSVAAVADDDRAEDAADSDVADGSEEA